MNFVAIDYYYCTTRQSNMNKLRGSAMDRLIEVVTKSAKTTCYFKASYAPKIQKLSQTPLNSDNFNNG